MLRVVNCVVGCVWLDIPKPTEWQRIGNQIDAAIIFVRKFRGLFYPKICERFITQGTPSIWGVCPAAYHPDLLEKRILSFSGRVAP